MAGKSVPSDNCAKQDASMGGFWSMASNTVVLLFHNAVHRKRCDDMVDNGCCDIVDHTCVCLKINGSFFYDLNMILSFKENVV
jgi:hypothetical protein